MIDFLTGGLLNLPWYFVLFYTLFTTHITITAVTIFLHRSQTHRALDLHGVPSHFFRFWLWVGTGMQTKEWVAIHRKHHAKCETVDDPHSPQTRGLKNVLLNGAELYRAEAKNADTLERYGRGTPDDWLERHVYTRFPWQGVGLMLLLNLTLFGALGLTVWAVQMLWIPISAAGVINGVGHFWGYRNFESEDQSRNISPIGLLIGGEELHNNHHTYPTSAKFSVHKHEFDIGWAYIRTLQFLGLARVKALPPKLSQGALEPVSERTVNVVIKHRFALMKDFMRTVGMHSMFDELRDLWLDTAKTKDQAVRHLTEWCNTAESSLMPELALFSKRLRSIS